MCKNKNYTHRKKELEKLALQSPDFGNEKVMNTHTFMKANVQNFIPIYPSAMYTDFYQKYRLGQWLNGLDAAFFEKSYPVHVKGWKDFEERIRSQTSILATYHFGAFQLINYQLIRAQIPYALLVAGDVKADWNKRYPSLIRELAMAEAQGRFVLLDANDRASLRKMYNYIEAGFQLLIYVDGLEGLSTTTADSSVKVPFLGQEIIVPSGTAKLSQTLNVPITPFLTLRRPDEIEFICFEGIMPDTKNNRRHFYKRTSEALYSLLSPYIMHWPEQWTNWPLLHLLLSDRPVIESRSKKLDERYDAITAADFGLFTWKGSSYLLQNRDYKSFPLNKMDFGALFRQLYETC